MEYYDIHTHRTLPEPGIREIENIILRDKGSLPPLQAGRCYSVGIHPWHIPHTRERSDLFDTLEEIFRHPRIVAVGECGIDLRQQTPAFFQSRIFEYQIILSEAVQKPLIIHCVKAWDEVIRLHSRLRPSQPWIVHGFRGKPQLAEMLLQHGLWLSVGIHCPAALSGAVPLGRLLPETDNSSKPVTAVYDRIASLWGISLPALQEQMQENVARLFPRLAAL